jgi:glutathione S-transferase
MAHPVLWQFKYSHYNEKVRWALDFKRIPHRRRSLLPGAHILPILWMTGQKSVPVLALDGRPIADSTRIIAALEQAYPDPALYPADAGARRRALEIEEFFDEELGPHLRRVWFHELLVDANYTASQLTVGFGAATRRVFRALFPVVRPVMARDMGINTANAEASRPKVYAAFDRLEAELQPSGYLVGERFSIADLTAASLFSPLVMPPEFPYPLLSPLPETAARFRESLAGRRGFGWVADVYRRHRGTSMEVANVQVPLKR